jgi:hypothetical protein
MPPKTIPEPWHSFLKELDSALSDEFHFHCMGGFVVTLFYGFSRTTSDLDVLSVVTTDDRISALVELGGEGSALHKTYGVYLHYVTVAQVPDGYDERLTEMFPGTFGHLRLFALDPSDLALSLPSKIRPDSHCKTDSPAGRNRKLPSLRSFQGITLPRRRLEGHPRKASIRPLLLIYETVKSRFHDSHAFLHHDADRTRRLVWKEIGDPNQASLAIRVCENLRGRVVVGKRPADGRPDKAPGGIVDVDDWLADYHTAPERHDALSRFKLRIDHKPGYEPGVQGADVSQGSPDVVNTRVGQEFFSNRSHDCSPPAESFA